MEIRSQGEDHLTPQDSKSEENKTAPSAAESEAATRKSRDEVALELMKFIAVTTGYGKGSSAAAGFSGKPSKSSEEYAESLIQLFERCRSVVAKPVSE